MGVGGEIEGVGRPYPPVRKDTVTPRQMLIMILANLRERLFCRPSDMTRTKSNNEVLRDDRKNNQDNNHATPLTMTIMITTTTTIEISFDLATKKNSRTCICA